MVFYIIHTVKLTLKIKFSIKDFFSKCDQIRRKPRIWSYLLKKSLMGNFIFLCSVTAIDFRRYWLREQCLTATAES